MEEEYFELAELDQFSHSAGTFLLLERNGRQLASDDAIPTRIYDMLPEVEILKKMFLLKNIFWIF